MTDTLAAQIEALAPCPFCGNDGSGPIEHALHVCFHELDWRDNAWSVQCDKCTATMGYSDSEEEAIAAWNTRPAIVTALRQAEERAYSVLASDKHHPGHVLIPAGKFDQLVAAARLNDTPPANITVGEMAQAETYRYMHEIATKELGYESILEALEAAPHADDKEKPDTYQIGPLTLKYVFGPFGKPDGAEWQTVLDTVEHELKTREYMAGQLAEETP